MKGLIVKSIIFGLVILVSISAGVTPTNIPESKIVPLTDDGQNITLKVIRSMVAG